MRPLHVLLLLAMTMLFAPTAGAAGVRPCSAAHLTLTRDWIGSRGTGVSAAVLQLTNRGTTACLLQRRPHLTLLDHSGRIPFVVEYIRRCVLFCDHRHAVTPSTPVAISPRASVYVAFDSYRCDGPTLRVATSARIVVGGRALVVRLPGSRPAIAWCGRGDPGSSLNLSPCEETVGLAAQRA